MTKEKKPKYTSMAKFVCYFSCAFSMSIFQMPLPYSYQRFSFNNLITVFEHQQTKIFCLWGNEGRFMNI